MRSSGEGLIPSAIGNCEIPGPRRKFEVERSADCDDENGSITPLIVIYFVIAMMLAFVTADVSSAYIARRALYNDVEAALKLGLQEIDEWAYYYDLPNRGNFPRDPVTGARRVPVNCGDAREVVARGIPQGATFEGFSCDGYEISAKVSQPHSLPFQLAPFGITEFTNRVEVGVTSRYQE